MANGKKTGGRNIKPGQVLNPLGRPVLPKEIKEARAMNKLKFEELLNKYLSMTPKEINDVRMDENTPSLDLIVCQVIAKAVSKGDHLRLNFLLDRLIGKPKEVIAHIGGEGGGEGAVIVLPSNRRDLE